MSKAVDRDDPTLECPVPMSLNSLLRLILPREDHFYDFLERQAEVADRAARSLARFKDGTAQAKAIRDEVQEIEHEGDRLAHEMIEALGRTFVTPIDREDLQRLSKRLDDIPDLCNAAARACVLFGVDHPTRPMTLLMDKLCECTRVIKATVPHLRPRAYGEVIAACRSINHYEKDGDAVFRDALSALFHDPAVDAKTILREKEILEDLEKAINRCDQAAELLTNIAVKNT
jgi:uncharacterized protein Yka (UPF0111/DUF47 family)